MTTKPPTTPGKPNSHDGVHAALLAAHDAMNPLLKDARANYGKYATLANVIETIAEPLHQNGVIWFQAVDVRDNGEVLLVTTLAHIESGEKIESRYPVRCKDPQDPQKVGGAVTYARRYSLLSLLGLAPEDDDGASASTPPPPPRPTPMRQNNGQQQRPTAQPAPEMTSWTELWSWLREQGFKDKAAAEGFMGRPMANMTPQQVKDDIERGIAEAEGR